MDSTLCLKNRSMMRTCIFLISLILPVTYSTNSYTTQKDIFSVLKDFRTDSDPHLHNDASASASARASILPAPLSDLQRHGTTTLAIVHGDNVVVACDSMASVGEYVGSRTVRKVFPLGRGQGSESGSVRVVATMAGGAADCAFWIRRTALQARIIEQDLGCLLPPSTYARLLAQSLRNYRGSGLSVGTMVAGWHKETGPQLMYVDSEGVCAPGRVLSVGSGSSLAYAALDSVLRAPGIRAKSQEGCGNDAKDNRGDGGESRSTDVPISLSLESVVDAAAWAVRQATGRDSFSGGFVNVLVIGPESGSKSTGFRHVKRIDARTMPMSQSSRQG